MASARVKGEMKVDKTYIITLCICYINLMSSVILVHVMLVF